MSNCCLWPASLSVCLSVCLIFKYIGFIYYTLHRGEFDRVITLFFYYWLNIILNIKNINFILKFTSIYLVIDKRCWIAPFARSRCELMVQLNLSLTILWT